MGCIPVHPPDVLPEHRRVAFSPDWFARLPLLFADAFQVSIAVLVQSMISDKDGFNDLAVLSDRDDCQVLDIKIDPNRHQTRIQLTVFDPSCLDLFGLREMQFRRLAAENEFGTLLVPSRLPTTVLMPATVLDGVVGPRLGLSCVHLQAHKHRSLI